MFKFGNDINIMWFFINDNINSKIIEIIVKLDEIKNPSPFFFMIFRILLPPSNIEQYPNDNADNPTHNIISAIKTENASNTCSKI